MARTAVPSLSTSGWVESLIEKTDILLSHFFLADYHQSSLYKGSVTSLPWIIANYGNDQIKVTDKMRIALEQYFSRYFDSSVWQVTAEVPENAADNRMILHMYGTVMQEGKEYSVAKSVETADNRFIRVLQANNQGT